MKNILLAIFLLVSVSSFSQVTTILTNKNKVTVTNKTFNGANNTFTNIPQLSIRALPDSLLSKQQRLISGTNIKTINGISLLGSGDITIGGGGGSGTVTSFGIATANGFSGSVANSTTTPVLTLTTSVTGLIKGNGTSLSAAVAGTDYLTPTGSAANLTSFPTLNQNTTGSAASLTTARLIYGNSFNGTANLTATISDGFIASAATWNAKQAPLSGTGFVKISGTTISYDNSTYLTTGTAASTYAPIASPTFTGTVVLPSTTSIGSVSSTEIGYLDNVTSSIQTQLDAKGTGTVSSGTTGRLAIYSGSTTVSSTIGTNGQIPIVNSGSVTWADGLAVTITTPANGDVLQYSGSGFVNRALTSGLMDVNGNELIKFVSNASAVNELSLSNSSTGNPVTFSLTGGDANISAVFLPKGTGSIQFGNTSRTESSLQIVGSTGRFLFGGSNGRELIIEDNSGNISNLDVYAGNWYAVHDITFATGKKLASASGNLLLEAPVSSFIQTTQPIYIDGDHIRIGTNKTPASASATGTTGQICWDASYVYVCVATNTWKRSAITTW